MTTSISGHKPTGCGEDGTPRENSRVYVQIWYWQMTYWRLQTISICSREFNLSRVANSDRVLWHRGTGCSHTKVETLVLLFLSFVPIKWIGQPGRPLESMCVMSHREDARVKKINKAVTKDWVRGPVQYLVERKTPKAKKIALPPSRQFLMSIITQGHEPSVSMPQLAVGSHARIRPDLPERAPLQSPHAHMLRWLTRKEKRVFTRRMHTLTGYLTPPPNSGCGISIGRSVAHSNFASLGSNATLTSGHAWLSGDMAEKKPVGAVSQSTPQTDYELAR
ncbi:hypothetical protein EV421DRAFT_1732980 [Armillaria borealis]|uniref:Uncharacterized protein n=1 Tax=Armillaria borealis TaxID=47425 RepID=A0AA39JTY4_9AGAR|nr:hypothetical protein EV421DRAFT_1732980 [Armillaria borealis]